MSGVDNRIVTMQFNNREFEQNAKTSLSTLQKIKESMNFGSIAGGTIRGLGAISSALSKLGLKTPFGPMIAGANKGLAGVGLVLDKLGMKNPFTSGVQGASELQRAAQAAGGPGGMGVLEGGVTAVSSKFIALSTIAITALSNITNRAINAGTSFAKSFTIAPIMDGLREYETNLKAIQTVQANTDRPLPEINKALQELNAYSDQTIYNFGEMAKNVGTFTAAGVDLKTSVSSIKGIANMAALSGSSSEQAATAMYQLSQAIASGKVGLMDWNSVVNAGMGGKKLQGALAQTAVAMGAIDKAQVKGVESGKQLTIAGQSFRESIMASPGKESWLTSGVLTNALASLDGRYSEAALSQELLKDGTLKYKTATEVTTAVEKARSAAAKDGIKYTDEQFAALQKLSTAAFESATKVKTLGQVFDIAKETIASGWSASFQSIFGNLKQAKMLFTGMSNGLTDIIKKNALARNTMLATWSAGGGRTDLIDGLKNAWKALLGLLGPIKQGFRDIFPAKTASDLLSMSERFKEFTERLIPGQATMRNVRDIAAGFFSVLHIGGQIIGGVVTMFKTLFSAVGGGNGDFLSFAGGIGEAITRFDQFLEKSGIITTFFTGLGNILSVPLAILKGFGSIIAGLFGGFDLGAANKIGGAVDGISGKLTGLQAVGENIRAFFAGIGEFFGNLGGHIANALMGIGDVVAGAFTADTFGSTLDVINTTLLGGLVLMIRNFFNKGVNIDLTGGLFDGIKETLGEATSAFQNMQNTLKADILLKLAFAIGVMAAALLVLSTIDPAALTKALVAMGAGFGVLTGAMAVLMKTLGAAGLVQLYIVTSAMTKMALSILLLAFALKVLAGINFGDMLRGLVGLALMMQILSKTMPILAASSKGMGRASFSLILLGVALNILAVALKIFATMSWEEMAKGLIMLTGTLLALAIGLKLMPPLQAEALGLIALGIAMNLLAVALKVFGNMSLEEMAKSLVVLGGSLFIIGAAIRAMPKTMMLQAAALVLVAGALVVLSGALKIMGGMGWEEIAKGMVVLAGSLIILAVGLNAIGPMGLIGAVGLLAAAAALTVFVPVMLALGAMSWESIIKSLTMLAGIFVILGVAGYLLAPVVPVILALGVALLLMGAGLALAGAGALAAATAFGIVVAAGAAGIQLLVQFLATLVAAIPPALAAFGRGIVAFAGEIGKGAPQIAIAMGKLMNKLLGEVLKAIPKIGRVMLALVNMAINVVLKSVPRLANAGLKMINGLLQAVARNVGKIVKSATDLVVNFLNALSRNLPRIIQAGVRFIISFVNGVANAIRNNKDAMGRAGLNLASALIGGVTSGIRGGAHLITEAAMSAARNAFNAAKDFFRIGGPSRLMCEEIGLPIPQGLAGGIRKGAPQVVREIGDLGQVTASKITQVMDGVNDAFALNPNLNPVISPVLDLAALTQEANKMSGILATAPIMPTVSYQTASDISSMANASDDDGPDERPGSGKGGNTNLTLELHSPKPIDSVESYRAGKTLISLAKEALK